MKHEDDMRTVLTGRGKSGNVVLSEPGSLQSPGPPAEPACLGSAALPSWWPRPAASAEHTGGCSSAGGSGRSPDGGLPYTGCPPASGPP